MRCAAGKVAASGVGKKGGKIGLKTEPSTQAVGGFTGKSARAFADARSPLNTIKKTIILVTAFPQSTGSLRATPGHKGAQQAAKAKRRRQTERNESRKRSLSRTIGRMLI